MQYEDYDRLEEEEKTLPKKRLGRRPPKKSWSEMNKATKKKETKKRLQKKRKESEKA
jgi:hypothetical protein